MHWSYRSFTEINISFCRYRSFPIGNISKGGKLWKIPRRIRRQGALASKSLELKHADSREKGSEDMMSTDVPLSSASSRTICEDVNKATLSWPAGRAWAPSVRDLQYACCRMHDDNRPVEQLPKVGGKEGRREGKDSPRGRNVARPRRQFVSPSKRAFETWQKVVGSRESADSRFYSRDP